MQLLISHIRIVNGGGGVWGETVMAAHPNLPESDVQQMVQCYLSLSNRTQPKNLCHTQAQ
jgi:cytochrome c